MEKFTTEQLKALVYDNLVNIEQAQNNIKLINQEIAKRSTPTSEVTGTEVPEKKEATGADKTE